MRLPMPSGGGMYQLHPPPHLHGHCNLGFGGRLWPQMVGIAAHEAHAPQEAPHDLLKERVVPEELCNDVGISCLQEQQ